MPLRRTFRHTFRGRRGGGGGTPVGPTTLFLDTFSGPDGSLDADTPDIDVVGGGWVESQGNWSVVSNQMAALNVGQNVCYAETNESDVKITVTDAEVGGIAMNIVDNDNFWLMADDANLYENNAGVFTSRGSSTDPSDPTELMISRSGASIEAQIGSETLISYTSSLHQAATKQGARMFNGGSPGRVQDNFKVVTN